MKKVLPILLLAIAGHSQAQQLEAGQKMLSGSFSFSNSNSDKNYYDQTNLTFNPSFSKVKNKNTIYGAFVSFGYSGYRYQATPPFNGKIRSNDFDAGIGIFVQKLKWLNDKWFLYAEMGAQGGIGTHKAYDKIDNDKQNKGNSWNAGVYLAPGVSYRLTQRLLVDLRFNNLLSISYLQRHPKENTLPNFSEYPDGDNLSIYSSLNNNTLGNIGVGFRWLLN